MGTNLHYSKEQFVDQLARASVAYLRTGMSIFHGSAGTDTGSRQAAVGNLAIAIELMAKGYLAEKSLSLVLKGDAYVNRAYDLVTSDVRERGQFRKLTLQLVGGQADLRPLDEILSALYDFVPEAGKELSYVLKKNIGLYRNAAVHASYHARNVHQAEMAAWAALRLHTLLQEAGYTRLSDLYEVSSKDQSFLTAFVAERAQQLETKVAKARQLASSIPAPVDVAIEDDLVSHAVGCPVCGHVALLSGSVTYEHHLVMDPKGDVDDVFSFFFAASTLGCPSCHLKLDDPWELERQGVALSYDVTEHIEGLSDGEQTDLLDRLGFFDTFVSWDDFQDWEPEG